MSERITRRRNKTDRGLIHLLNRRYHAEWVRAELLANELAGMRCSKLWRMVSWLRRFLPRRSVSAPVIITRAVPFMPRPASKPMATVSIVIPFRDQVELLRNCLRSLRRSTYRRFEVILVNNGSTEPRTRRFLSK